MRDDEAIVVRGPERFSRHEGYGRDGPRRFRFAGAFEDPAGRAPRDARGRAPTALVAFDARPARGDADRRAQYSAPWLLRDLTKLAAAFGLGAPRAALPPPAAVAEDGRASGRALATGNWGCGAFGGDPQLKALLQWAVASLGGWDEVHYYPFGDARVADLRSVAERVAARATASELIGALFDYDVARGASEEGEAPSVFAHVERWLEAKGAG